MTAHDLAERPGTPAAQARKELPGLAGRYRSLFVLGRGGMGTVEAALELEPEASRDNAANPYRRVVALKRLLPDTRDSRRTEMFLREARLAAMLDHPNVVRAYDYGELDGELYLSMEYVEGQPLSRVLRAVADQGERIAVPLAAWLISEVCRGLHAAHELADPEAGTPLGLVHRDVSPQNVMVGYDGRVRLLDFGVAKIETESLTKTGEVKGKTAYMSPEQAMGDPLDRRSDLFGIGAVLFECLALRRMWGDGTDMDVIRKLALESPPPLELDGVAVPEGLVTLHARLVSRDPNGRPATALDVATALAPFSGDASTDETRASSDLRALLERHFGDQAIEQRARLSSTLDSVDPERAEHLRESLLPHRTSTSMKVHAAAAARDAPAPATTRKRGTRALAFGVACLAIATGVAWWIATDRSTVAPAPSPETPAVTTSAVASPPSPITLTAKAVESEAPSPPPPPTTRPTPAVSQTTTRPRPSPPAASTAATPRTAPTSKVPDLDEKPF